MDKELGLTFQEVEKRIQKFGYNEIPDNKSKAFIILLKEIITEPMIILLLAGSGLYVLIGDINEAIPLLLSVVAVIGITILEENKTEKALASLRDLGSPKAQVLRDGQDQIIPSREVVVGDILVLNDGNKIPADAKLLSCSNFTAGEALLTGESQPVPKSIGQNIFMGTLITTGHGLAEVTKTGVSSEMGQIGKSLSIIENEKSATKKEVDRAVKIVAAFGLSLCLVLTIYLGVASSNWTKGILSGITLAMSLIPEEIPVILTIFMALGAWRMSRQNVLIRKLPAIETLGTATVICLDKTGTITQNKMAIESLWTNDGYWTVGSSEIFSLPNNYKEVIKFAILASRRRTNDPMEEAIKEFGKDFWGTNTLFEDWRLLSEIPPSEKFMGTSMVWQTSDQEEIKATKGAPEAIIKECHLNIIEAKKIRLQVEEMAKSGLRVLAVANKQSFLGLIGLTDPLRPTIKEAIKKCYQASIKVKIITGDHYETAHKIAAEVGIRNADDYLLGDNIKDMGFEELKNRVRTVNIFARITPTEKLKIIEALKDNGEIVAMIGDGVNDAPALKSAHIGVAMGKKGTDVAREAASIVLLEDNFISVVEAIKLGRRIYDNVKKASCYALSMHIPIAGLALIPAFLGLPIVFFPIHIVLLELFIDPTCSIVFEAQEADSSIMKRPPRSPNSHLFNREVLQNTLIQGSVALALCLGVYYFAVNSGLIDAQTRGVTYLTLMMINLGLVLVNLSWTETVLPQIRKFNLPTTVLLLSGVTIFVMVIIFPGLRQILQIDLFPLPYFWLALGAAFLNACWFEIYKILNNNVRRRQLRYNVRRL